MKKTLFTLFLLLAIFAIVPSAAQTDSISDGTTPPDEIEAFSDTTSLADGDDMYDDDDSYAGVDDDAYDDDDFFQSGGFSFHTIMKDMDGEDIMGMFFVLAVLLIIFVISPIFIIGLILWFIYKNRKDRMRLAEMAMQHGQPIPDELMPRPAEEDVDVRQKGIRQVCLGIGLIFFLGWAAGKIGLGIGVLVLCIGLGNLLIARSNKRE